MYALLVTLLTFFKPYRLDSPLKWQPRCIKAFPDQKGYALASIEGRVSIQYIDKMDQQR